MGGRWSLWRWRGIRRGRRTEGERHRAGAEGGNRIRRRRLRRRGHWCRRLSRDLRLDRFRRVMRFHRRRRSGAGRCSRRWSVRVRRCRARRIVQRCNRCRSGGRHLLRHVLSRHVEVKWCSGGAWIGIARLQERMGDAAVLSARIEEHAVAGSGGRRHDIRVRRVVLRRRDGSATKQKQHRKRCSGPASKPHQTQAHCPNRAGQ